MVRLLRMSDKGLKGVEEDPFKKVDQIHDSLIKKDRQRISKHYAKPFNKYLGFNGFNEVGLLLLLHTTSKNVKTSYSNWLTSL